MTRHIVFTFLLVSLTSTTLTAQDSFYFRAEALVLDRNNGTRFQNVVENTGTTAPLATTDSFDFDVEVGPRLTIGYVDRCGCGIQASYFGIGDINDQTVVVGAAVLTLPGDVALATFDFTSADRIQIDYSSDFYNGEFNFTCPCSCCVDILAGFRYLTLEEGFNINSTVIGIGTSDYNIRTDNDLLGGQVGLLVNRDFRNGIGWGFVGKLGLFLNDASHDTLFRDSNNTIVLRDVSVSTSKAAFLAEAGLIGHWTISRGIRLFAGYNLLWLDGIALAPDQLDFTNTPNSSNFINTDGSLFAQVGNAGFEVTW